MKLKRKPKVHVTVRLSEETYNQLILIKRKEKRACAFIVREALEKYLASNTLIKEK